MNLTNMQFILFYVFILCSLISVATPGE